MCCGPSEVRLLIAELARWSDATFTDHRDPERTLVHLQREVTEALVAVRHELDDVAFEFADLFMLVVDAARRYGLEWDELLWYVQAKHEINLQRTWGKPDADGVVEHVRTQPSGARESEA